MNFLKKKKRKQNPSLTGHIPPCVSSLQLWSSSPAPCCRWQTCECLDLSSSFYKTAAELSGLSLGWGRLEQGIHPSAQPWDLLPDPESVRMPPSGPGSLLLSFPCLLIQKSSVHDKSPVQGGLSPPSWVGADATPALCRSLLSASFYIWAAKGLRGCQNHFQLLNPFLGC